MNNTQVILFFFFYWGIFTYVILWFINVPLDKLIKLKINV